MDIILQSFYIFFAFCLALYYTQKRPKNFPPGPQWVPIIGNSIQLRREARKLKGTHNVYQKWSKELNSPDVIGFRLGKQLVVVGLSVKAVKDIHMRSVFEGRPRNFFMKLRAFNTLAGITSAEGELWREHRSFAMKRLRSVGFGGDPMQEMMEKELLEFKAIIDKKMEEVGSVWPGEFLQKAVMNVLWTFVAGSEDKDILSDKMFHLLSLRLKAFDLSGGLLSDFPWLRFIAPEFSGYNVMVRFNEEIRSFLVRIIDDHHRNYSEDKANDDLIYAFIHEMKKQINEKETSTFTDTQLMIVILDLFIAGASSTSLTFNISLMTLVLRQDIQEQIHGEIQRAQEGFLKIAQHKDFPITEAYLLEVARFYNIAPIGGPRRALEDTDLCGFTIPKDTTVLIGLQSVHMDEKLWGDPEVFRPSRFLDESGKKLCNTENVIQFGEGRRQCLGFSLAKAFIFTFFTDIVRNYTLSLANGEKLPSQELDCGIMKRIEPYKVVFSKRK
ncbi:probable cytochrome P450 305a1 [Phlebotomus argentipes]|uniref:probable cytochrome P450 305a1 n=1 Tax=Phlebotomus argentipes TaxID=94469 RepID=UPI002892C611|nr:probable cytochrome P450 305a1 [Phlebotomus argentipes]